MSSRKHDLLSESACAWALRYGFVSVAMETQSAGSSGTDDAVAVGCIRGKLRCAIFESKVSRADFRADAKKWHRRYAPHPRVSERWYVAEAGLIAVEELPEGWGLLEADTDGRVHIARRAAVLPLTTDQYDTALAACAKACAQKYLKGRDCVWCHNGIHVHPDVWREAVS